MRRAGLGCHGKVGDVGMPGAGGGGNIGVGGAAGNDVPCAGAAEPRLVVANQRIMLLTKPQIINMVRYLINDTEAQALVSSGMFSIKSFADMYFPPADGEETNLNPSNIVPLNNLAHHVGNYVTTNFAAVTKCTTRERTPARRRI